MEVKVTVEDIMKTLNYLQKYCLVLDDCRQCCFYCNCSDEDDAKRECQLKKLFSELDYYPTGWDLEEIEWLLKQ